MFAVLWLAAKITLIGVFALGCALVGFVLGTEEASGRSSEGPSWADLDIDPRYRR
jgi:hypothetical protein